MKAPLAALAVAILFTGCASRYDQAVEKARMTPFENRPALYDQMLKSGEISREDYVYWMEGWESAKDEKAALASMTPKERAQYRLAKESLELQRQQVAASQAEAYAAGASLRHGSIRSANNNLNRTANTMAVTSAINAQ